METSEGRVLGFTGSSRIITPAQARSIRQFVEEFRPLITHDGDCIYGDAIFRYIVRTYCPYTRTVAHPAFPVGHRARANTFAHEVRPIPLPRNGKSVPLTRNEDIVLEINFLLAAPATDEEILRSGTWATVRYARWHGVPYALVLPSGEIKLPEVILPNLQ